MDTVLVSAMLLAAVALLSAMAGGTLARIFWAQDLKMAREIDAIRSQTEGHLRAQITSLENTIHTQDQRIDILQRTHQ